MAKVKLLDPSDSRRRLDRYELIGEIASGGMATVFLARLAGVGGFQRFVAIKRLHPHLAEEEEFVEMFLDEARLAAGIHHPHVVPILEVGTSDSGGYYLVMEYIEGDTLARIVARALSGGSAVPRPILLRIILDTLSGLHAAHELTDSNGQLIELVHRDCSPQNVLVGVDGCSRITDFGVARATARLSTTRADRLKGKLAYMSPEQAKGDIDVDRRADVFSMGIVLWEVLAGRRLFKAENEAATLSRVLMDKIPRLNKVAPTVPAVFDEVCAKALDRDLSKRYQSAAELADALERAGRAAALATPSELGVASPREVAGYVQSALGQDIAAQRESVRAWLSQTGSEPSFSQTRNKGAPAAVIPYDRTVKMPLVDPKADPHSRSVDHTKEQRGDGPSIEIGPGSLTFVDLAPDSGPPDTLVGIGKHAPSKGAFAASSGSLTLVKAPPPGDGAPGSGRTMLGVGPSYESLNQAANPRTLLGTGPTNHHANGSATNGIATHDLDGEEEGETTLMQREGELGKQTPLPPSPRPSVNPDSSRFAETAPISRAPAALRYYEKPKSSRKRYVAVVIGLLAAVIAFASYRLVGMDQAPTATRPSGAPTVNASAAPRLADDKADPRSRSADQAPTPAVTTAPTPAPTAEAEATPPPEVRAHEDPRVTTPPRPAYPRGARPRPPEPPPKSPPPSGPAAPPPAPPPAAPDGDLSNPYR